MKAVGMAVMVNNGFSDIGAVCLHCFTNYLSWGNKNALHLPKVFSFLVIYPMLDCSSFLAFVTIYWSVEVKNSILPCIQMILQCCLCWWPAKDFNVWHIFTFLGNNTSVQDAIRFLKAMENLENNFSKTVFPQKYLNQIPSFKNFNYKQIFWCIWFSSFEQKL